MRTADESVAAPCGRPGGAQAFREGERLAGQPHAAAPHRPCGCRSAGVGSPVDGLIGDDPVEQLAVEVAPRPPALSSSAAKAMNGRRRALEHLAADDRADRDDGRPAASSASRMPGTARIGPIETSGLEGPITIALARGDRLEHLGARRGLLGAAELQTLDRARRRARGS